MFLRAMRFLAAGALIAAVAVPACGNTSESSSSATAGSGGKAAQGGAAGATARGGTAGQSTTPPLACGTSACKDDTLPIPGYGPFTIAACCADAATNTCGLDSSFLALVGPTFDVACQPLAQPGSIDKSCPNSPKESAPNTPALSFTFQGCCRAGGTCGYMLDTIGGLPSLPLGLGCVDSAPFQDGGAPLPCGDSGVPGAGGQGGGGAFGAGGAFSAGGEGAAAGTTGD
jgi:hypothetical protein